MAATQLLDPADDKWHQAAEHDDCLDGTCGHCEGAGTIDCTCDCCGDDHKADCEHCGGTGNCEFDGNINAQRRKRAKATWDAFKEELSYRPTVENFTKAYRQMFGAEPPEQAVTDWWAMVSKLASDAGVAL